MLEILEKFVKNLKKLDSYYVLRQEKEHIIIGTKIEILEHKLEVTQIFRTYQPKPENKVLPVFFLVTVALKPLEIDKMFLNNKIPILSLKKKSLSVEEIKEKLEQFIENNFKY